MRHRYAVEPGTDISTYVDALRQLGFTGSTGSAGDLENIMDGMSRLRSDAYDVDFVAVGPIVNGEAEVAAGVYDNDGAALAVFGALATGVGLLVTLSGGLVARQLLKRERNVGRSRAER